MLLKFSPSSRSGFTLIELLLVVGIIGILVSIVILSINPARQLAQARDRQRGSDINAILNAIYQYSIDNNGNFPDSLSGSTTLFPIERIVPICKGTLRRGGTEASTGGTCPADTSGVANAVSLFPLTVSGRYLRSIPIDSSVPTSSGWTRYYVQKLLNGRIEVRATQEVGSGTYMKVQK
jgi:prepilin-type N-terminal cleavage/methylation domain-containing protein